MEPFAFRHGGYGEERRKTLCSSASKGFFVVGERRHQRNEY
ncbi:hypothetical protein [Dictyobacter formicarum]|nr:hypothetical protein [Dictyobacter formicarum]